MIYAVDSETELTTSANLTPDVICWTGSDGQTADGPFDPASFVHKLKACRDKGIVVAGANIPSDFGAAVAKDPTALPIIFDLYHEGLVWDVLTAEALAAIADGTLGRDPRDGQTIRNEKGRLTGRYSLHFVSSLHLGRDDAKESGFWRTRYGLLKGMPPADWPAEAVKYPLDDAQKTAQVAISQWRKAESGEYRNLQGLPEQVETAWAMHLGSIWGIKACPERVETLKRYLTPAYEAVGARLRALGFLREDGTQDQAAVKRAVVRAYSPLSGPCGTCSGSGKTPTGKNGNLVTCKDCDGTGLELGVTPRTESGRVSKDRDTLVESDDHDLESLAENEVDKIVNTYLPQLEQAAREPLCPRPNVLVESGRTSYDGLVQLMPRKIYWPKGFAPPKSDDFGVRGCFKARDGYYYLSVDYAALELCTLGQVCLWVCGYSEMARAINVSGDPGLLHTRFAASLVGKSVEEVVALIAAKDPAAKGWRQAAKAANFGFPGGMGSAKLVLAKRKRSEGETAGRDRLYPGIRFCIALGGEAECGREKITSFKGRECPPVCKRCVEIVEHDLRPGYFRLWPEMKDYFSWVSRCVDGSGEIECLSPEVDGRRLVERVRGGVDFCSAANNGFQALASDLAKAAYRKATREAYLDPSSALWGCRFPLFLHDEIFGEVPQLTAHEAAWRLSDVMITEGGRYTPDVKLDAKPALSIYWLKDAELRINEAGRLIPWDL